MEKKYSNLIKYVQFTQEEDIIHHLLLKASSYKCNGLFYGKLGIAIAFFEFGKYRNNPVYTDYAMELKESLPKIIEEKITNDFASGICGFGWGIEYMIQQKYIGNNNIDACSTIDEKIMAVDIRRMNDLSLETGLEGFLHYIMIRLSGARKRNDPRPFDDTYLNDIRWKLHFLQDEIISVGLRNLKQLFFCFVNIDIPFYKPDIYSFTKDLVLKSENDITAAKLGLVDGLAGKLIQLIDGLEKQKNLKYEKYFYNRRIRQFKNKRYWLIPT